jgi:hypothetical protein
MARRINAKLVLELLGRGMSGREIYRSRRIAQQSVKKVRDAARQRGVSWEDVSTMSEKEVTCCSPKGPRSRTPPPKWITTTFTTSCNATA